MNEDQFTRIKQSPRQASTTDVEDLCDEIERLREHAVILASTAEAVVRERCAAKCEALSRSAFRLHPGTTMEGDCGDECAAAIRDA